MNKKDFEVLCEIWREEHHKYQDVSGLIQRAIEKGALK